MQRCVYTAIYCAVFFCSSWKVLCLKYFIEGMGVPEKFKYRRKSTETAH